MNDAPAQPAGASVVRPVTVEEQAATSLFLNWTSELREYAAEMGARARLAQDGACR